MTLGALLARTVALFAAGALLMAIGSASQPPTVKRQRWLKFTVFFLIVHAVLGLAALGRPGAIILVLTVLCASTVEAVRAWRLMARPRPLVLAILAAAGALACVAAAAAATPPSIAWLFMCCAAFDGFSQVTGQWLGRTRLAPRVSPAKTVEGLVGGCAGAVIVGLWLRHLAGRSIQQAVLLACLAALASLAGDLAGSWMKRSAGLKDFSGVLPGHGGVLDRFNSFLAAMALVGTWM